MRAARIREHLRSNVIGYVCLVWLMTGTAVAATQLPAGSVGTRQLRKGAVTGVKVKRNTLTGRQIKESSLGTVPSAASAATAASATNASNAANAAQLGGASPDAFQKRVTGACSGTSAVQQVSADGTVTCEPVGTITKVTPGTGLTGGGDTGDVTLDANTSVLQKRVSGGCTTAIQDVFADGSVSCARGSIGGLSKTVAAAHGLNFGNFGDMDIGLSCGNDGTTFVRILLSNETGGAATLNYLYHDGSVMTASGTSLADQGDAIFDSNNGRIEGQFILAGPHSVTTANLHAFKGLHTGCEISGTTVKSTF
jgi:hypothetical protein